MNDEQIAVLDAGLQMIQRPHVLLTDIGVTERNILTKHYGNELWQNTSYWGRKVVLDAISRPGYFADSGE